MNTGHFSIKYACDGASGEDNGSLLIDNQIDNKKKFGQDLLHILGHEMPFVVTR